MAHIKNLLLAGSFLIFSLLTVNPSISIGAVFNVSNSMELRNALLTSESNGEIDFINIAPGIYNTGGLPFSYIAALTENFGLNITGSGAANTVLSGQGISAVLIIDTGSVINDFGVNINIEDLSINNGNSAPLSSIAGGLSIISDNGNVMIHSCEFEDNIGDIGGGAWVDTFGQISISGSTFDNNTSLSSGGGALLTANFIILTDNLFNMNSANSVTSRGGGVRALALATNGGSPANGTILFNGNIFSNNDSTGHAGASLVAEFGVELQGNGFLDNTAGNAGAGGVYIEVLNTDPGPPSPFPPELPPNVLLTRLFSNLFQSNQTIGGDGGGAYVMAGLDIVSVNNIFLDNIGDSAGGALLQAPDIIFTNNTLSLNEAINGDGGGLLLIVENETTADIYNNIAYFNVADGMGADIFVNDDPDVNQIGAMVNLVANDFTDFFSLCESIPICFPNINDMDNIDRDPRFVDLADNNVNLRRGSPARKAGDSDAPQLPSSDAVGNPVGDPPDMGALQFVGGGGGSGSNTCSLANPEINQNYSIAGLFILLIPLLLIPLRIIQRRITVQA